MGWPDGASAVWGSASPSASAITCAVAAVPRNWQPPPGDAQARQPMSRRLRERDEPVGEARADRLRLARILAVAGGQGDSAGHDHRGQVAAGGEGHGHGGQPLVAGGHAHHRLARGQRADEPPQDDGGVVAIGEAVEHAARPLGASVAGIGAEGGEGNAARARGSPPPPPARGGRPPSGRCDSRGRAGVPSGLRMPPSVLSTSTSGRRRSAGVQPMPTFCDQPKTSPLGRSTRSAGVRGRLPGGPGWEAVTR